MTFEFLVVCHMTLESDLLSILAELLRKAMEENLNEYEDETLRSMIDLTHCRQGDEHKADNGDVYRYEIRCFRLKLPSDIESAHTVVDEFTDALSETPPVIHAIRFDDPLLQMELEQRAREIRAIELKLRRVLSIVYLHANQTTDPYELLRDEIVQPMARETPTLSRMKVAAENQFFHLTFGQYINLNQKPEIKLPVLLEIVRSAEQYEALRTEILRMPVEQEDDVGLLAGLKERMDAIEKMRNCVAHNRRPTRTVTDNYENALPLLNSLLDDYLLTYVVN